MKKMFKGFILGVIITTLLMSTAIGAQVKKTIEVIYNSVNLEVNGKAVQADNILYNGTTYVPLRAMAEMLGKEVGWDGDTNTASINDKVEQQIPKVDDKNETMSQKNAVGKAESYLEYTSFSKEGLIHQLEFEGFSKEDATYAVNKIKVDWKEQAVKKAKSYLEYSTFSKDGLIHQLKFEGFTDEESEHAAKEVGY